MNKLAMTLNRVLKSHGFEGCLSEYRVFGQWEKAVGPVMARHAQPQSMHGKKLTLTVDSPAWMQQLSLMKPEIIAKVNQGLGWEAIRDITLRLGEVSLSPKSAVAPLGDITISHEERVEMERCVQDIRDPETREAMRHLMEKDFVSRKREGSR